MCSAETVKKNGYGVEINRYCSDWRTVGTGLYATPEMYQAMLVIDRIQARDVIGNTWDLIIKLREDPFGYVNKYAYNKQAIESDIIALMTMNGCDSPALRRFAENLRLFALNEPGITINSKRATTPSSVILSENQDFDQLVNDLISVQSRKWSMNKYNHGSVYKVIITSKDELGQPSELTAKYLFNGSSAGSVRITFNQGLPACLYFSDFPYSCKTADRKVAAEFAKGKYQQ